MIGNAVMKLVSPLSLWIITAEGRGQHLIQWQGEHKCIIDHKIRKTLTVANRRMTITNRLVFLRTKPMSCQELHCLTCITPNNQEHASRKLMSDITMENHSPSQFSDLIQFTDIKTTN